MVVTVIAIVAVIAVLMAIRPRSHRQDMTAMNGPANGLSLSLAQNPDQGPERSAPRSPAQSKQDSANAQVGAFTISAPVAASPPTLTEQPIQGEDDFRRRFPGEWSFLKDDRGRIRTIAGGPMRVQASDTTKIPGIVSLLAPLLDLVPEQVLSRGVRANGITEASQTFELDQVVDGYEVFGGILRIHARIGDGAVYIVDNLTQPVGDYNRQVSVTAADSENILRQKYPEASQIKMIRGPVLWTGSQTQLAWIFNVSFNLPRFHTAQVLVGASNGDILSELPATTE
ncbi:MAG: hypothetical protein C5B49_04090 [Bdellovibrio sp.]|nr:MAG: hypothetical protein C5B49_04090 [Bdellovibrio sp.]